MYAVMLYGLLCFFNAVLFECMCVCFVCNALCDVVCAGVLCIAVFLYVKRWFRVLWVSYCAM